VHENLSLETIVSCVQRPLRPCGVMPHRTSAAVRDGQHPQEMRPELVQKKSVLFDSQKQTLKLNAEGQSQA
jgi:hypothetical protein